MNFMHFCTRTTQGAGDVKNSKQRRERIYALAVSSPLVMYHFVAEFLAPVVSYLMTDEAGCDCTV